MMYNNPMSDALLSMQYVEHLSYENLFRCLQR